MIRIVQSTNRAEVEALLTPAVIRDRATEKKAPRRSSRTCATSGDAALRRYARALDGWSGPLEVSRRQIEAGAKKAPAAVRAALKQAADGDSRRRRGAAAARVARVGRRRASRVEQRVIPLERVGCYVPGGRYPLPSSLLMTAIPARVAGVPEVDRLQPVGRSGGAGGGGRGRRRSGVPARRRARRGGDGLRHEDGAARQQDRRARQPLGVGRQGAGGAGLPDRLLRRADRDPDRGRARPGRRGSPPTSSPRPSTTPTPARCSSPSKLALAARGGRRGGAAAARRPARPPRRSGITAASS